MVKPSFTDIEQQAGAREEKAIGGIVQRLEGKKGLDTWCSGTYRGEYCVDA